MEGNFQVSTVNVLSSRIIRQGWRSYVIVCSVCHSVEQDYSRTRQRTSTRHGSLAWARGDTLAVIVVWYWSGRGSRISFSLSLTLLYRCTFYTTYCHSPGGDTAAVLADTAVLYDRFTHRKAIVQQPWRSLHSLGAVVSDFARFMPIDRTLFSLVTTLSRLGWSTLQLNWFHKSNGLLIWCKH